MWLHIKSSQPEKDHDIVAARKRPWRMTPLTTFTRILKCDRRATHIAAGFNVDVRYPKLNFESCYWKYWKHSLVSILTSDFPSIKEHEPGNFNLRFMFYFGLNKTLIKKIKTNSCFLRLKNTYTLDKKGENNRFKTRATLFGGLIFIDSHHHNFLWLMSNQVPIWFHIIEWIFWSIRS